MRSLDRLRQSYDEDTQVVIQDKRSPPRMLFSDTEVLLEEVPVGTRVVFPNPPVEELANWRAAIRWAINHPEGCDPLHAQLRPGMRRSEEHTSELQSRQYLVCRLLLEK